MTPISPEEKTWKQKYTALQRSMSWKFLKRIFISLFLALGILVIVLGISQGYLFLGRIQRNLDDIHKLQYAQLDDILIMRTALVEECKDANTLRNYLLLPLKNCDFFAENDDQKQPKETAEQALYFYVTLLKSKEEKDTVARQIHMFIEKWNTLSSEDDARLFTIASEEVTEGETLHIILNHEEKNLAELVFFPLEKTFLFKSPDESEEFHSLDELLRKTDSFLKDESQAVDQVSSQSSSPNSLEENSKDEDTQQPVSLKKNPDLALFREEVKATVSDPLFQKYLASLGFSLEIFDSSGQGHTPLATLKKNSEVIRNIFVDSQNGVLMGSKPDGTSAAALIGLRDMIKAAQAERERDLSEFKNITPDTSTGRENILFLGHNGGNIDTIILGNVDHSQKHITLMSIPRDLFVDEYKINAFYSRYGMGSFISKIEELIGQRVSHHVLIDFSIFIDGIDMLGGIDIYLARDIADPTYKTFDNDEWGTMYFTKGIHHVSGVQALRLARSRATSSDFERAKRQQQILAAAQEKAKTLTIKNANTVVNIIRNVIQRVQTDLSPQEAIVQFFTLKDYDVRTGNVMSTGNILTSTKRDSVNGTSQYILIPIDEDEDGEPDWDLLKKFVWKKILE